MEAYFTVKTWRILMYLLFQKLKLPVQVVGQVFATICENRSRETIHDLWRIKGCGSKAARASNLYSMRLNLKYRLEMTPDWKSEAKTVGILYRSIFQTITIEGAIPILQIRPQP
ncbi:MAG: hypothetical protein IPJ00_13045 [Saprospirales bacterium]|nr:hypothetical protein [Saprospirales bacterium]